MQMEYSFHIPIHCYRKHKKESVVSENGVCLKKYRYKNDERLLLIYEFKGDEMIEYDDKRKRVYQG